MLTRIPVFSRLSVKRENARISPFFRFLLIRRKAVSVPAPPHSRPRESRDCPDWQPSTAVQPGKYYPDWNPLAPAAGGASASGFPALKPAGLSFKNRWIPSARHGIKAALRGNAPREAGALFSAAFVLQSNGVIHLRIPIKAWEKKERLAVFYRGTRLPPYRGDEFQIREQCQILKISV